MLFTIPLSIIPLIVYNIIAFGLLGAFPGNPWTNPVFTVEMMSGARWTMVIGDLMVAVAIALLFFEILKATRTGASSIVDHMLSMVVFIVYLIEFLLVAEAAKSTFFILMMIALIDVVAGFSITIRAARRDMSLGHPGDVF